jgi:hypothetical protein
MDKNRNNDDWINRDWEVTLPFRILEVALFLMLTAFLIQYPEEVWGFIPVSLVDFAKAFVLAGLIALSIGSACYRIRNKKTAGAFLVVDYAITGAGAFFLGVFVILLLVQI